MSYENQLGFFTKYPQYIKYWKLLFYCKFLKWKLDIKIEEIDIFRFARAQLFLFQTICMVKALFTEIWNRKICSWTITAMPKWLILAFRKWSLRAAKPGLFAVHQNMSHPRSFSIKVMIVQWIIGHLESSCANFSWERKYYCGWASEASETTVYSGWIHRLFHKALLHTY